MSRPAVPAFDLSRSHEENIKAILRANGATDADLDAIIGAIVDEWHAADVARIAPLREQIRAINDIGAGGPPYIIVPGLDVHRSDLNLAAQRAAIDNYGTAAGLINQALQRYLYINNIAANHWDLVPADSVMPIIQASGEDVACGCYTIMQILANSGISSIAKQEFLNGLPGDLTHDEKNQLLHCLVPKAVSNLGIEAPLARRFVSAIIESTVNDGSTLLRRNAVESVRRNGYQLAHEDIGFALEALERVGIRSIQMSDLQNVAQVQNRASDGERRQRILDRLAGRGSDTPEQATRLKEDTLEYITNHLLTRKVDPIPIITGIRAYGVEVERVRQENLARIARERAAAEAARAAGAKAMEDARRKAIEDAASLRVKIASAPPASKAPIVDFVNGVMGSKTYIDAFFAKDFSLSTISNPANHLNPLATAYNACTSITLPAGENLNDEIIKEFRRQYLISLLDKYKNSGLSELSAMVDGFKNAQLNSLKNLDRLIQDAVDANNKANDKAKKKTPKTDAEKKAQEKELITEQPTEDEYSKYLDQAREVIFERNKALKGYKIRTSLKGEKIEIDDEGRKYGIVNYKNTQLLEEEIRLMKLKSHKNIECSPFLRCGEMYKLVVMQGENSMVITLNKDQIDAIVKEADKNSDPKKTLNQKIAFIIRREAQRVGNSPFFAGCAIEVEKNIHQFNQPCHVKMAIFTPKSDGNYGQDEILTEIPGTNLSLRIRVASTDKTITTPREVRNRVGMGAAAVGVVVGAASVAAPPVLAPISAALFLPSIFLGTDIVENEKRLARGDLIIDGMVVNKSGEPVRESELSISDKQAIDHFRKGRIVAQSATAVTKAPSTSCKAYSAHLFSRQVSRTDIIGR